MKAGTEIFYQLITDSRFDADTLPKINDLFNQLCNEIEGKLSIKHLHAITPRLLNWDDGSHQYRIDCTLILNSSMTLNEVYQITNKVQPRQLKVNRPKNITIYA